VLQLAAEAVREPSASWSRIHLGCTGRKSDGDLVVHECKAMVELDLGDVLAPNPSNTRRGVRDVAASPAREPRAAQEERRAAARF
jgi:hypothetical protein